MRKRGQVTVFILLGIVMLIAFFLIYYIIAGTSIELSDEVSETSKFPKDILPIHNYIKECVTQTSQQGITLMGSSGGQMEIRGANNQIQVPIENFMIENQNLVPSAQDLQKTLDSFMEYFVPVCTIDIDFPGYNIKSETPTIKTQFVEDKIVQEIIFPVTVMKGKRKTEFSKFYIEHNIRMNTILNSANKIVKNTITDPEWINYADFAEFDVNVIVNPIQENYFIYTIIDDQSQFGEELFPFNFGIVYSLEELEQRNFPPELLLKKPKIAKVNQTYTYDVSALDPEGDALTYGINRDDMTIDDLTGLIRFTPTEEDIGTLLVEVIVTDSQGGFDKQILEFEVEN